MTTSRVLPEPHRYAVCPPADTPIKEYYKGVFEEIFIVFPIYQTENNGI